MEIVINELSYFYIEDRTKAEQVFINFSKVVQVLYDSGFKTLKVWDKGVLFSHLFSVNFRLSEWLKQNKYFSDEVRSIIQLLKSQLSKHDSIIETEDTRIVENIPYLYVEIDGLLEFSRGLKVAFINGAISVSFQTTEIWNNHILQPLAINENYENIVKVYHASELHHVNQHYDWIIQLRDKLDFKKSWNPSKLYFPDLKFSNQIVNGNWSVFESKRDAAKSIEERRCVIIQYADIVAKRNLYKYESKISSLNTTPKRKRYIYSAGEGKDKIYLSIDLEKGGFEVCDFDGFHLGEFSFSGKQTKPPKKNHSIRIKS